MTLRMFAALLVFVHFTLQGQSISSRTDPRSIDKYAAHLRTITSKRGSGQVFAKVPGKSELIPIQTKATFPEDTEISYYVYVSKRGQVLAYSEIPVIESGDLYISLNYYFDSDGALALLDYMVDSYTSGCTIILRYRLRLYFDSDFALIGRKAGFTDVDYKPLSIKGCEVHVKFPFTIYPEVSDLPKSVLRATKGIKEDGP